MIHQFRQNGYNIIVDPNSGSIHSVDAAAYDVVAMYKTHTKDEIFVAVGDKHGISPTELDELLEDIARLESDGMLFSSPPHEEAPPATTRYTKALCLHISHQCNFRCTYCFAGRGDYGSSGLMSAEVGRAAIDWLCANSGSIRNLDIDFFGGEPLLNLEVIQEIIDYARSIESQWSKRFRFTLTTNGLLIDDAVIDLCNREMDNVVLSIDGRREVNDKMRKTSAGESAYDLILPKFQRIVDARGGKNYYIRGTYTAFNTDFADDILHLADLGFKELSMEPAVSPPDSPHLWALKEAHLQEILEQYDHLTREMLVRQGSQREFNFYHYMVDLEGGPCLSKRVQGCGAGVNYLSVTPEGEFYPCHRFVGLGEYMIGDVKSGITKADVTEKFASCNLYTKPECTQCWAKYFCSGGCAANFYHASGDIGGTDHFGCALIKKRLECAIVLKAAKEAKI